MSALHCTTCKFTLNCTTEEVAAYKTTMPMHCGKSMMWAGEAASTSEPVEPSKADTKIKKKKKA